MTDVMMAEHQVLLVTRQRGREVADKLPGDRQLRLNFKGVEVASPSFLDELIKGVFAKGTRVVVFSNVSSRTKDSLELLTSMQNPSSRAYPLIEILEEDPSG
jgi:hypothetical protein